MCCVLTALLLLGPRFALLIWWLINPLRFAQAFGTWLLPLLSSIFFPWTTIAYLLVFPGGVMGLDWLWIALGVLGDLAWYAGGGFRKRAPGYRGR